MRSVLDAHFSKIWNNNKPFVIIKVEQIPEAKNTCSYCGKVFPRGFLWIIPFDTPLSHKERWEYPNRNRKYPKEPEFLPSPRGQKTVKFYCIHRQCIMKQFPFFKSKLFEVPLLDFELKDSRKGI